VDSDRFWARGGRYNDNTQFLMRTNEVLYKKFLRRLLPRKKCSGTGFDEFEGGKMRNPLEDLEKLRDLPPGKLSPDNFG